MAQGIRFITDISNVVIKATYTGEPIADGVRLGDIDYPVENPSTYSVFGAWQDTSTLQILNDNASLKDGQTLKAINTAPVAVTEINAFTDDTSSQTHTYTTMNVSAPRRLQGTPITKFTKLSWTDVTKNVKAPNDYPMQGISASSDGSNLIDLTKSSVGDFMSNIVTNSGSQIASLPLYDIFVKDFKGGEGLTHLVVDPVGGKLADGSSSSNGSYPHVQYGETLKSYLSREGRYDLLNQSKMTPPSEDQYFQGLMAWSSDTDGNGNSMTGVHVDMTSKMYPPVASMFSGHYWEIHIYPKWATYETNADGSLKNTSNATLTNSDGDVIGNYTDLPPKTTINDLINGKYQGTDANGNTIPVGTNLTSKLGSVQKPLSELANDDVVTSIQWTPSEMIQQDNTKGAVSYTSLSKMDYDKVDISWAALMQGDASTKANPTSTLDKDKLPSVKIGNTPLTIDSNNKIKYGDITIWDGAKWSGDASASGAKWVASNQTLTFDEPGKVQDITNMASFGTYGTANLQPVSSGATLDNGNIVDTANDILQPGDNDIDTTGATSNLRPVTYDHPASVSVIEPSGDTVNPDGNTKEMLMDPSDIGKPLNELTSYSTLNYTIANGYIVTTTDGKQTIVDPTDSNWIDKIGGIDKLPGASISQTIQFPAGRNQYYADANGGQFFDGSAVTTVYTNQTSMSLGVLRLMMPVATKGFAFSTGYNDSTSHTSISPNSKMIDVGSTIYAMYQAIEGSFKRYPREFWLVDRSTITSFPDDLVKYDLNDVKNISTGLIAADPENLGFNNTEQVISSMSRWSSMSSQRTDNIDVQQITFKLYMKDYASYDRLGQWLQSKHLALYYLNNQGYQNFINVSIASLTKSELSTASVGYFQSTLTLNVLSSWYDIQSLKEGVFNNNANGLAGNIYVDINLSGLANASSVSLSLQKMSQDGKSWVEVAKESIVAWDGSDTLHYSSEPSSIVIESSKGDVSGSIDFLNGSPLIASGQGTWRIQASSGSVYGTAYRERLIN